MDALLQKVRGEVHALRAQQVEAERKHRSELATAQLQYQNDLLKHQVSAVFWARRPMNGYFAYEVGDV